MKPSGSLVPFSASSVKQGRFPLICRPQRDFVERAAKDTPLDQSPGFESALQGLGEAIFAGDYEDAQNRLDYFRRCLAGTPDETEFVWQELERVSEGRLSERSEKGLLEAAIETPGIPWKTTDKHLLFLARALQDKEPGRVEDEKRFILSLYESGEPLYAEPGFEKAYDFVNAFSTRVDWENPYVNKDRINEAVSFAMERLAGAMSRYLAVVPAENDPVLEDLKAFFQSLSEVSRLMFVKAANPEDETLPADSQVGQPSSCNEELSEQEEQYLGSNAIFYRQMMMQGYLTIFGNIVLGTLALLKDEQARNKFLTAQYRNIRSITKKYESPGVDRIDLIQTAWLGLQKALDIYEPWQGTLFWTVAKKWVFGAIVLEFKKTLNFIRTMEPVEELDGETYQEAFESLITRRGMAVDGASAEQSEVEFTHEEARQFVRDLMALLDEHDEAILLAWIKEGNIIKVADQFGTSKQNISNALGRIRNAGRQLAHERCIMPQAKWDKFKREELASHTQRLVEYARKRATEGPPTSSLKLQRTLSSLVAPVKSWKRLRPLLAAEKAGLLSIAQHRFEEDQAGEAKAIQNFRELFLSGKDTQVQFYLEDLAQRLDFDSDALKDQFLNLAILELFQSLSWKSKSATLAEAVASAGEGKILNGKEPPYTDVIAAAKRFLESFPARNKTPELEKSIRDTLIKISMSTRRETFNILSSKTRSTRQR